MNQSFTIYDVKIVYAFFISITFISTPRLKLAKTKQMLGSTLRLNFLYLKIIHVPHPSYHPKIIGHILKNKPKKKYVCKNEGENEK